MRFKARFPNGTARLLCAAVGWLLFGVLPIAASILAEATASTLGCYITEASAYSRSGTPGDFSDDLPFCRIGPIDIGPYLVDANTGIYAIFLTWPFILLSLFYWAKLIYRLVKFGSGRKTNSPT